MITTEINKSTPLSSIKPLDQMQDYRSFCIEETKTALAKGAKARTASPAGHTALEDAGDVKGLVYKRCVKSNTIFLEKTPDLKAWDALLKKVNERRQQPKGFHAEVAGTRAENVHMPKLEWMENTLRFEGIKEANVLELVIPPSKFTSLLKSSSTIRSADTISEMDVLLKTQALKNEAYDAAILFESLDHVPDPAALLKATAKSLKKGGLIFVTALVSSGFDMQALGLRNQYFYPPDRTFCFSLTDLKSMVAKHGFQLIEVSTPGVLDLEIVQAHRKKFKDLTFSNFENEILNSNDETRAAFQTYLQQAGFSSFARIVGRKI